MESKRISALELVLYGALTWAIPFVVAIPLMGRNGQPVVPAATFKSLMIVVGSAAGAWLLLRAFRRRPAFRHAGFVVGLLWLAIIIGLDVVVLIPVAKIGLAEYLGETALRYLVIPIMAIAVDTAGRTSGARGPNSPATAA